MRLLSWLQISERRQYRLLEMIPGSLVWLTFLLAIILSFVRPLLAIYVIILFDLYWLMRVLYFIFYLFIAWARYRKEIQVNWLARLQQEHATEYKDIYHIIFFPFYKEGYDVLRHTFEELTKTSYDLKKFIIVLGGEARVEEQATKGASRIQQEYGHRFFRFLFTLHPPNLPGELQGKGSNANYMGRQAKELVDTLRIPYDKLIVSYFDIDTVTHPQYFAYLTYTFLNAKNPLRTSYQPVALFNNNIWSANPITRVAAFGTTFWLFSELPRPDRLYTFSSHSMSWQALVDVGFWQKDIVTDDSRIFLQCFFRYDGDYTVTPLYMPVSMDTVEAGTLWQSLVNLYKQQRRWAWGVEHFPYILWNFFKTKNIPMRKKFKYIWNLGEGMYSWATAPIIIFILGRLPLYFVSGAEAEQVLVQNAPFVLEWLLRLSMVGIFVSAVLSLLLLPPRPKTKSFSHVGIMLLQWILLPVTLICFGSIPAIESQTRLMLGKYLGFFNTPKQRT